VFVQKRDGMTRSHIAAYSLGHLPNDLTVTMWIFYFTVYSENVVGLDSSVVAIAVLLGQIADGLMTPIVGVYSDSINTRWGKRKPWYFGGAVVVIASFVGMFASPSFIVKHDRTKEEWEKARENGEDMTLQNWWFIIIPALYNFGWAAVQIAHMSIVNQLSNSNRMRDKLSSYRNGFIYGSNMLVLGTATYMFYSIDGEKLQYRYICYVATALSIAAAVFYIIKIDEVKLSAEAKRLEEEYQNNLLGQNTVELMGTNQVNESTELTMEKSDKEKDEEESVKGHWSDWLKQPIFYIFGTVYTMARMALNITLAMQPFYLQTVLKFEAAEGKTTPIELGLVPLTSCMMSLFFSLFVMQKVTRWLKNRFLPMVLAIFIVSIASLPLAFLGESWRNLVYPLIGMQGIAIAILLNTSTAMISDVIGKDSENSAFVYGTYSLFEKIANGIILYFLIEELKEEAAVLKFVMAGIPLICSCIASLMTYIGAKKYSHKLAKITGIAPS